MSLQHNFSAIPGSYKVNTLPSRPAKHWQDFFNARCWYPACCCCCWQAQCTAGSQEPSCCQLLPNAVLLRQHVLLWLQGARQESCCCRYLHLCQLHATFQSAHCPYLLPSAAYKEVKASAKEQKGSKFKLLEVCSGHNLVVTERLVSLDGPASATFFERAEEVEECNVSLGVDFERLCQGIWLCASELVFQRAAPVFDESAQSAMRAWRVLLCALRLASSGLFVDCGRSVHTARLSAPSHLP